MILVDYFRADRPLDKLKNYGIKSNDDKIINYVNNLEFGKLQKLLLS